MYKTFKRYLMILSMGFASVVSATKSYNNPTFGKSYKAGSLQNWLLAQNEPAKSEASTLNLDQAELAPTTSVGPFQNLNFGGALDFRLYMPRPHGMIDDEIGFGNFDIHVSEVFLTTDIGNHISILTEQLLITSEMGTTIGQDHGYTYAIFSSIPYLPESFALKVGRMRYRFGIDARSDAPANPLKTPVYKTLGIISDKGVEASALLGPIDLSLGVLNGVDTIEVYDTVNSKMLMENAEIKNPGKPILVRAGADLFDSLSVGLSAFWGHTYPVINANGFSMSDMIFNADLDKTKIARKSRYALDLKYKMTSKFDFATEYSWGKDKVSDQEFNPWSAYGRIDYKIVQQKWILQLQYDYFEDGRSRSDTSRDLGTIGLGLNHYIEEQASIRLALLSDDRGIFRKIDGEPYAPEYLGVLQTLISF